jgi:DNA-binding LacI/PurR family transcriptional regulator
MANLTLETEQMLPLASEVEEIVVSKINEGILKPGERLGSVKELSEQLNASYGTVRQTLERLAARGVVTRRPRAGTFISKDPFRFSHATSGHAIKTKTCTLFALLLPDIQQPEYACITRCIQDVAHEKDLDVIVSSTDNDRERYDQLIRRQIDSGVAGMVLVSPNRSRISLDVLSELSASKIPVVNIGRILDAMEWPTVLTDVEHGRYIAVKHLCSLGRKRIGCISYPSDRSLQANIRCGLYKAYYESQVNHEDQSELTIPTRLYSFGADYSTDDEHFGLISDWLDENKNLDGICCGHDHIAAMVLRVLRKRGMSVPADIAVTSYGNMGQYFGLGASELTTVDTCLVQQSAEIVRLLLAMKNGETVEPDLRVMIKPKLIVGRTTVPQESQVA